MPLSASRVSAGTSATVLADAAAAFIKKESVTLTHKGPASVFLGGAGVTVAQGFELVAGAVLNLELDADDTIYGIVASGSIEVSVLRIN